jgi:hypothetical protein
MKSKWDNVNCHYCSSWKHCKHKSVMKGSAYCELQKGIITSHRASNIGRIRQLWITLRERGLR